MPSTPPVPGICLIAEAREGASWLSRVAAALQATQATTLALVPPTGVTAFELSATRALVAMAQAKGIAAIVADDVEMARQTGADGVHLSSRPEIEQAYETARAALGEKAIVGADPGLSRHDAMTLGEAGADYIAFSDAADAQGEDELAARIAWWAEIFVVPVVAFGIETPDGVSEMVASGADFVAIRLPTGTTADGDAAWAGALRAALVGPAHAA